MSCGSLLQSRSYYHFQFVSFFFLFSSHTLSAIIAPAHPIFNSSYPISLPLSSSVTNILLNLLSSSTVSLINFIKFLSHTLFLLHSSRIFSFPHCVFCFILPSLLIQHPLFHFLSLHLNRLHPLHFLSLACSPFFHLFQNPLFLSLTITLRLSNFYFLSISLSLAISLSLNLPSHLLSLPRLFDSHFPPLVLVIPSYSLSSSNLPHQPSLSFSCVLFISKFLLKSLPLPLTISFPLFEALSHSLSFDHHTLSSTALLRFHFHIRILLLLNSFLPFLLILFHSLTLPICSPMLLLSN